MKEAILEIYQDTKEKIDMYFLAAIKPNNVNAKSDFIDCVFYIGQATTLAFILEEDFDTATKDERVALGKIKNYIESACL